MSARKRKKRLRNDVWQLLCIFLIEEAGPCGHDTAYGCRAEGRHDRRALGPVYWRWGPDRKLIEAVASKTQPPRLWMSGGQRHHQRYRNRRTRR